MNIKYRRIVYMIATAILRHNDKEYKVKVEYQGDYEETSLLFHWLEGNYCCDCNRSLFIGQQCDENFPELECSGIDNEVQLIELFMEDESIYKNIIIKGDNA